MCGKAKCYYYYPRNGYYYNPPTDDNVAINLLRKRSTKQKQVPEFPTSIKNDIELHFILRLVRCLNINILSESYRYLI
jgi:hypothetical protein